MKKVEMHAGLILSGFLVFLHAVFLFHAGALWRDEVNCVEMALLPNIEDIWANLEYDSFPILWHLAMRLWLFVGMSIGGGDLFIRILGFVVGTSVIGALWWNAKQFGHRVPLIALALVGFNVTIISVGDSIRAYGLGTAIGLMTMGAVWRLSVMGRYRDWLVFLTASLLAVHILYYNAVVVFAVCIAGAFLCLWDRRWKQMAAVMGVGLLTACSLIPYLGVIAKAKSWTVIVRYPIDIFWIWHKFQEAMTSTALWLPFFWTGLILASVAVTGLAMRKSTETDQSGNRLVIFAGVLLLVCTISYILFLKILSYYMQPWYFIVFIAISGACIDAIFARSGSKGREQLLRVVLSLVIVLSVAGNVLLHTVERKTNMDTLAAILEKEAVPGDLIVLSRWYYGLPFKRYYQGHVPWTTVPPISSYHLMRIDLLKQQMESRGVMTPVLASADRSLKDGRRVWIVGDLVLPLRGERVPVNAPMPNEGGGWSDGPYYYLWNKQMAAFLAAHGGHWREAKTESPYPVSMYENLKLFVVDR